MKRRFITYEEIIENYYGGDQIRSKKKRRISADPITFSKVFDNGEKLVQTGVPHVSLEEYVVQPPLGGGEIFEEYVIQSSLPSQDAFEGYVVRSSTQDPHTPKAYSPSLPGQNISPSDEYQFDLMGSLSTGNKSNSNNKLQDPYTPADRIPQIRERNPAGSAQPKVTGLASTDSDFEQDFKDILQGKKLYDQSIGKTVDKGEVASQQSNQPSKQSPSTPTQIHEFANGHAIFDEIAKKMKYATAYDLGAVEVDKRFNDFDKIAELQRLANAAKATRTSALSETAANQTNYKEPEVNTTDFIKDLDTIKKGAHWQTMSDPETTIATVASPVAIDVHTAGWPSRPTNLRPIRTAEKISEFGEFTYVDDPSQFNGDGIRVTNDWATQNIISVSIPQLNGKTFGKHAITNGTINFHKQAADRLRNLWASWENAGLLDRILSFEGGYAARYIRGTEGRSPRPLSNHAWGTAFDINATFNRFGAEPALVGQKGSVRELVTIANQNGFFWGGHFTHQDGMHFEIAHSV